MAKKSATKVAKKKNTPDNDVAEIYVMIGDMGHSIQAWRWSGLKHQYTFSWDAVLRKHIIKFDDVASYEAAREDLVHNSGGKMLGRQGFQVMIVTSKMKKELDAKRERRAERLNQARIAQIQESQKADKSIEKANDALEEVRKKIGAASNAKEAINKLKLKATSLK